MTADLKPRDGRLFVVRWIQANGANVKHRYYRREHEARAFHRRLVAGGWEAEVFLTMTTWTAIDS